MPYDPNRGTYQFVDEQIAFPQQTTGHRAKQPLPRRDIVTAAEARQQAEREARQRNQHRNTRIPPDALPKVRSAPSTRQDDGAEEEFEDDPPRQHTSVIRYQPEEVIQHGNKRVHIGYVEVPPRRPAQQPSGSAQQRDRYADGIDEQETQRPVARVRRRTKLKFHWMVYLGIGLLIAIAGWIALTIIGTAWQRQLDDWQYGSSRTYQVDAVVGHGDSASNPSHFIALNVKGSILVIELPGGNIGKATSYPITTLPGNQGNPPVRLLFQDLRHSGHLDMLIQVGDPGSVITFMLFNNGTQFVGKL